MRVCLVGATHPCHNPRLVREADTLSSAGHDVRVVAPCVIPELAERDARLVARRRWRLERAELCPTRWRGRLRRWLDRGRRRVAALGFEATGSCSAAAASLLYDAPRMQALAEREPADWLIAHAQAALPVAARAAHRLGARLGFDCEDLLAEAGSDPPDRVRAIEARYLPLCRYVSVPSRAIAAWLEEQYSLRDAVVLYNVWPAALRGAMAPPLQRPPSARLRLHWFSQTIGPGRGIEDAIDACGELRAGVELHLRGSAAEGFQPLLEQRAQARGVALHIHPRVDHDELLQTLEGFDVGLALERADRQNQARTASNKLFAYLSAGLAVAATDTPGQREVLGERGELGFLYPPGDAPALASGLRRWLHDPARLRAAQLAAWTAGGGALSWDAAESGFLRLFEGG
jgi:glycosyltransferase involved in cell wall biosynthesis